MPGGDTSTVSLRTTLRRRRRRASVRTRAEDPHNWGGSVR